MDLNSAACTLRREALVFLIRSHFFFRYMWVCFIAGIALIKPVALSLDMISSERKKCVRFGARSITCLRGAL